MTIRRILAIVGYIERVGRDPGDVPCKFTMGAIADSLQSIIEQMKAEDDRKQAEIHSRLERINRLLKEYEAIDSAE